MKLMTVDEVAEYLGRPKHWLYNNHRAQGIPFKKVGQSLRCRPNDLDRWLDEQGGEVTFPDENPFSKRPAWETPEPIATPRRQSQPAVRSATGTGEPGLVSSPPAPRSVIRYEWERALWNCPDVPGKYKHVLAAASFFATFDSGRDLRAPQELIAETSGASLSSVGRAIKYARTKGWLWVDHKSTGKGDCDVHWLTIPRHDHGHGFKDMKARAREFDHTSH